MDSPIIDVRELVIDYWGLSGWTNIVNRVSFSVRAGETFGLVGESGCGKSTTAYSLIGYGRTNSRIRHGQVLFRGVDLFAAASAELQRIRGSQISFVPQNPTTALSPGMRIGAQISETLEAHRWGKNTAERQARTLELLEQVRLPDPTHTARKYPHQLSGGQQQRVVIALALACNPQLVVLDEPTTGLDVTTQAQILDLLVTLRTELHMAMVYVTHNMGVVATVCDRVGVMYAGELVEQSPTADLFSNPRHPYTRGLIASVPSIDAPEHGRSVLLKGILERDQLPVGCRFAPRCDFAQTACFEQPQVLEVINSAHDHAVACRRWPEIPALIGEEVTADDARPVQVRPIPQGEPLLDVHNLVIGYGGGGLFGGQPKIVVQDVSFDILPYETFALVGESGSGKSTIARTVEGLIQPVAGQMSFDGQDISRSVRQRSKRLRQELQLVLQNPDASLNPRQSVAQIIGRPLEMFLGLSGRALRNKVEALLEDVRLNRGYAERYPDQLSGGERQRVAIARALGVDPKLVLCDEVLSALDVSVQADVLDLLRDLQARRGVAYLFISHDLAVVRSLAHRVGVLYRGELVEYGRVEEVYAPPFHPYTHMLLSAVPEIGAEVHPSAAVRLDTTPSASDQKTACPFADRCPWKVGAICDEVKPPWQATSETHALRCHIPLAELSQRETWSRRKKDVPDALTSSTLAEHRD